MTDDDTFEDIHPCDFAAKFQTHTMETPTYNGILRVDDKERKVWDEAIEKELKSLTELGSFEMIDNPRGSNVLQSTWAFRKNWYPDGALKKYKVRFCVRGDQQINGLDVFDTYVLSYHGSRSDFCWYYLRYSIWQRNNWIIQMHSVKPRWIKMFL